MTDLAATIAPTIDRLHELFRYEPETGALFWRQRDRNLTGLECGGIDSRIGGYRRVRVDGRLFLAHRVIWAITSGAWPDGEIDHIDGNTANNRLSNLRVVPKAENLRNKTRYHSNRSGVAGVYWHKQHRKWAAAIQGKCIGVYRSFDDAKDARRRAELERGFHANHGRGK